MNHHNAEFLYDQYMSMRNAKVSKPLTREVFEARGIYTFRDLTRYLRKHSEYGGAIPLDDTGKLTLLPFHNDTLNKWLSFDNPRVVEAYERIYERYKARYPNRQSFEKHRFKVEECLLEELWAMPAMDTRLLDAPIVGCWDKMELQTRFLRTLGYEVRRFCFYSRKIIRGHTFILFNNGSRWQTADAYPFFVGTKDIERLYKWIFWILRHIPFLDQGPVCQMVEFEEPCEGMPAKEYLRLIERGNIVIQHRAKGRRYHDAHTD